MKNPPQTAHISLSRLKECRLVLSGTQALPLWNMLVLEGKYTLEIYNKFALLWGEAQKKIAYSYPKVTYSYPKVT